MRFAFALILLSCAVLLDPVRAALPDAAVPGYHGGPSRAGHYVAPGLTEQAAGSMHMAAGFDGRVNGHVYAQPLYWRAAGSLHGVLIVTTEDNEVDALDARTGAPVWRKSLGRPVPRSMLPCGDIDPEGITGTPAIDPQAGTLFLDAMIDRDGRPEHEVFALRL